MQMKSYVSHTLHTRVHL